MLIINIKKENFLYWLAGSFVTILIGLFQLFVIFSINCDVLGHLFFYFAILFPPFLGGFFIKYFNQELSVYYYGTIGLIFQILLFSLIFFLDDEPMSYSEFSLELGKILLLTIIVSIIGGLISILVNKIYKSKNN